MRVGRRFKKMAKRLMEGEASYLWSKVDGDTIYNGFKEQFRLKDEMRKRIEELALYVIEKARQSGEKVRITWHACHDPACATCGGTEDEHFHLSLDGKNKQKTNLEEWLSGYFSAEEILGFISLIQNRENLLVLLCYETILLQNLGLLAGE